MPFLNLNDIQFDDEPQEEAGKSNIIPLESVKFDNDFQTTAPQSKKNIENIVPLESIKFDDDSQADIRTGFIPDETMGRPISAITGKPVPTFEEKIEGSKTALSLPAYTIARGIRGAIPKIVESAVRKFDFPALHPENLKASFGDKKPKEEYSFKNPPSIIDDLVEFTGKNIPEGTGKDIIGGAAELVGAAVPVTAASEMATGVIKASENILKTLGVSTGLILKGTPVTKALAKHFSHGATTGAIYGMMEAGTPKEVINDAVLFGAIESVFGTSAPAIKKISESNWFRRLTIKERDLVVQTVQGMKDAGKTEAEILKGVMGSEREAFFAESLEKRGAKLTPDKPVQPEIKPVSEVNFDNIDKIPFTTTEEVDKFVLTATNDQIESFKKLRVEKLDEANALKKSGKFQESTVPGLESQLYQEAIDKFEQNKLGQKTASADKTEDPPTSDIPAEKGQGQAEIKPTKAEEKNITTPKEQKKYLIDAIDEAMENASKETPETFTEKKPSHQAGKWDWDASRNAILKSNKEKFGTIIIEVPNDGTFEIINTKQSLEKFKKQVSKPEVFSIPTEKKTPAIRRTTKRISGAGVQYYNEFKPRREGLIEAEKDTDGIKNNRYFDGWFSDGNYAIKTEKPKFTMRESEFEAKIKDVLPKDSELEPAKLLGEFYQGNEIPFVHVETESGLNFTFDAKYIDSILTKYPNAKAFSAGEEGKLVFKDNGEAVALAMPMRIGTATPEELFADRIAEIKGKSKTRPPAGIERGAEYSIGDYGNAPVVMQMPELIQLFKELSEGKYPEIKRKIGIAAGAFYPRTGDIKLQKDIFSNPDEAVKVLAHEIGHWIDWLPDKDLKRGNILGRIASLKGYMEHWLDDILGGKGRLTDIDKKFLMKEAKELAGGERWIDEVIEKTIPITPQDVLDIWNSMIPKEALNQDLLDYIMRIGTAEKKTIALAAMKGMVADEIKHLAHIVKQQTGNKIKIKIKARDKEVIDKFKELIAEELKKRNIYNRDEIARELKNFTQEWKPFDPLDDIKYTKYRFSSKELYADAMSGLLTNPDAFRITAPRFWSAWNTWIHRKPEFMAAWDTWQHKINTGSVEITKDRMKNIYEMFESNDKARIDESMKQREGSVVSVYDGLMTYFWDKNHKALGLLRSLKKKGGAQAQHATKTRYMIEEANYIASEISVFTSDIFEHIINPLEALGYDAKELGLVLFQKRILGDRSKIGNPLGHSPETTKIDIANIEKTIWGEKKTKDLNDFAKKLRDIRESLILPLIEESGLATPEFMKIIRDTKTYSTFSNIEWFKNKTGTGQGAGFYRQIGTLSEIENPLISMILKDMSLVRAARMNMTKQELIIDLLYSNVAEEANMRWSKDIKGRVPIPSPDSKKSLFSFMENGNPKHFYVSKKIVDMFEYSPFEAQQVATIWRALTQPLRELLVSKNPIWMVRNLLWRDTRQTIKNIPEVRLRDIPKLLLEYKRAFNETRKYVFAKKLSPSIRQMLLDKTLPVNRIWSGLDETVESELDRMGIELNLSKKQNDDSLIAIKAIKKIWNTLDKLGMMSDIWGKIAGWKYLKKYSTRSPIEISHVTRTRIGTPDYKRTGAGQQITNNIFLFSNIGKEGIRAAIESAGEDPGGYAWKTIWTNIMPKITIGALGSGAVVWGISKLGYDDKDEGIKYAKTLQRVIEGIPEYDRANYTIIPLGLTDKGKSAYLRIPEDYEGQFWGALAHKLMTKRFSGHEGISNLILEQSPYKPNPYITVMSKLMTYYIKGQNPEDEYRGNKIMSDTTHTAGGLKAHEAMLKSTWKELGLKLIYEPAWDGLEKSEAVYEKALKTFPLNTLGTFIRFSDQGITEKIERELGRGRKTKAKQSIESNEAFIELVNGTKLTQNQILLIVSKKEHVLKDKILSLLGRKYGDAYFRQLTRTDLSNDEKIMIMNLMLSDKQKQEIEENQNGNE